MKGRRYLVATYRKLNFLTTFRGARNSITRLGVRRGIILALCTRVFAWTRRETGIHIDTVDIDFRSERHTRKGEIWSHPFFPGELRNFKVRGGRKCPLDRVNATIYWQFFKKALGFMPDVRRSSKGVVSSIVCVCALVWVYRGKQ